ncbi:hypothetical protein [Actinoallomurus sp. NPDC052274]|uniref:hypothetical protein n=1 Tax=Actinoallomurus sp. NPDC052274 TaxID=3155420 RepID=UPI003420B396
MIYMVPHAYAHTLVSDRATRDEGIAMLQETSGLARGCGLNHQLRSIDAIRHEAEHFSVFQRREQPHHCQAVPTWRSRPLRRTRHGPGRSPTLTAA